ncbi:MAG: hypothetical protein FWD29_08150 [Micrococcales bacterium]|nr:hypothetical protein [Micrococcales bacterium]
MTKRRDIERRINAVAKARGWAVRTVEGGSHTKVQLGRHTIVLPRHREVQEQLGRAILRRLDQIELEDQ